MVACPECDLLQHEVEVAGPTDAHCIRCNALLYRGTRTRLDTLIALTLGDAFLVLASNVFPIATMDLQGARASTTLAGSAIALYQQGSPAVAALVLVTAVLLPVLQPAALLYLITPLRFGRVPRGVSPGLRFLLAARSWSMIEVFLLGLLVTLVKLSELASVIPGIALWSLIGWVLLSAAISASFSVRDFWAWVDAAKGALAPKAA